MTELSFTLPWPPSVNDYFAVMSKGPLAGRILISSKAKEYRQAARRTMSAQGVKPARLEGSIEVVIVAHPPNLRARDLDNILKPILDSLKTRMDSYVAEGEKRKQLIPGMFEDDSQIDRLTIERGPVIPDGRLLVQIRELAPGPAKQEGLGLEPARQ